MKSIVKFFDSLPVILKLIFALPIIDGIAFGIYRIAKGYIVPGIVWIFFGAAVGWIIDMITIIARGKVTLFAE